MYKILLQSDIIYIRGENSLKRSAPVSDQVRLPVGSKFFDLPVRPVTKTVKISIIRPNLISFAQENLLGDAAASPTALGRWVLWISSLEVT